MRIEIKARHKKWYLWTAIATFFIYFLYAVWSSFKGDWFNLAWLYLPPFYVFMYYNYKKNMTGRYLQLNDQQVEFYMPMQKQKVKLQWSDISNMEVKLLSIELATEERIEVVDLNAVSYANIKVIKKELTAQFQQIKSGTAA